LNINSVLKALLTNWWIIILTTALTTGSVALILLIQQPIYQAAATVELRPNPALDTNALVYVAGTLLDKRTTINTLARKAVSGSTEEQVAQSLNIPIETVRAANLNAIVIPDSNLIEIRAYSADPQMAAAIANAVADNMLDQTLEKVLLTSVIDQATPPTTPIEPQPTRLFTLGIMFGLVLGMVGALGLYIVQHRNELFRALMHHEVAAVLVGATDKSATLVAQRPVNGTLEAAGVDSKEL
jgi:uncharacterized protein involved in exopolysaccharide biosynthesis